MSSMDPSKSVQSRDWPGAAGGALSITFGYPSGGFLYRASTPRLRIDDAEAKVPGWGTHEFPVAPGRHRVQVWVPYALPRRAGRAYAEVTVRDSEQKALEYQAPTVTFMRGSLGAPGQQKSAGWSAIMVFNLIGGLILLVTLIAFVM